MHLKTGCLCFGDAACWCPVASVIVDCLHYVPGGAFTDHGPEELLVVQPDMLGAVIYQLHRLRAGAQHLSVFALQMLILVKLSVCIIETNFDMFVYYVKWIRDFSMKI